MSKSVEPPVLSLLDLVIYTINKIRDPSRNLPGPRGSVLTKYQPISSHGDPVHPRFFIFSNTINFPNRQNPASRIFYSYLILPSTQSVKFRTHQDFCATAWYIDSFCLVVHVYWMRAELWTFPSENLSNRAKTAECISPQFWSVQYWIMGSG